jgi:hypothetical protein
MPARQPLEMPGRYGFHSTRPAPWKRVSAALSVDRQSKSGANFRRTRRRCFSVWLSRSGKAWEDRPDRAIRHPLHSWHPTQVRDDRRALCRGAAFDLCCRSCQGCDLPLRQEAYASAVNPRGPQLSYSSLEFNFAMQRANDLSQLAHYRHPLNLLSCLEGLGPCRAPRPPLTSSHRRFAE